VTDWERELSELTRRNVLAQRMGGDEKVAKHRAQGKLTVRERIEALLDPGSFHEIGALTGRATYDDDDDAVRRRCLQLWLLHVDPRVGHARRGRRVRLGRRSGAVHDRRL